MYNAPSMTSRSSVYVVVEKFELWPPSRSIGVIRASGREGVMGARCSILSVGLAAGTQVCMRVCASAAVTESTSGVAFPSLHPVAFGRDRERRCSRCCTYGASIQSVNSA